MLSCLPLLLAASGFFSGSETALFSLSDHQRLQLRRSITITGMIVPRLLKDTRPLLITLLLSNVTVNVLYFVISTVLILRAKHNDWLGTAGIGGAGVLVLLTLILCGEVLPKMAAAKMPIRWSKLAAMPLLIVHQSLCPLRVVLSAFVIMPLARLIGPTTKPSNISTEELAQLLELSQQRGDISREEEQLLQQALELSQMTVKDLMRPRVDIRAYDLDNNSAELFQLIRETHLRKIPVYRGDLDHIEGVIYSREVLLSPPQDSRQVQSLIRQVTLVPETLRPDQLLVQFRRRGTTLAIVVDEYGGTEGLITLENVAEHIVGEIVGPYDEPGNTAMVERIEPGVWRISAALSVHDWDETFGEPVRAPMVSTVGGLVMQRLGRLPHVGDRTTIGNVVLEVETMDGKRVRSLVVHLRSDAPLLPGNRRFAAKEHSS